MNFKYLTTNDISKFNEKQKQKQLLTDKSKSRKCLIYGMILMLTISLFAIMTVLNKKINNTIISNTLFEKNKTTLLSQINITTEQSELLKEKTGKAQSLYYYTLVQLDNYIMLKNSNNKELKEGQTQIDELNSQLKIVKEEAVKLNKEFTLITNQISVITRNIDEKKKFLSDLLLRNNIHHYDSVLITSDSKYRLLSFWIMVNKPIEMKLLYRGSEHKFSIREFHDVADNPYLHNTLVIVKMDTGAIIGGFTYHNWSSYSSRDDIFAFVFNLDNRQKYRVSKSKEATTALSDYFVNFGQSADLLILSKEKALSSFPVNYGQQASLLELTNGKNEFSIEELELFTIINN